MTVVSGAIFGTFDLIFGLAFVFFKMVEDEKKTENDKNGDKRREKNEILNHFPSIRREKFDTPRNFLKRNVEKFRNNFE